VNEPGKELCWYKYESQRQSESQNKNQSQSQCQNQNPNQSESIRESKFRGLRRVREIKNDIVIRKDEVKILVDAALSCLEKTSEIRNKNRSDKT
jgi:hypothetical protein